MLERGLKGVRWRLFWVFVAFSLGGSLTWVFKTPIFHLLLAPAAGQLSETGKPIFTGPTEMFSLTISLVIKGGLIVALPVLMFHLYRLLGPLFTKAQRGLVVRFFGLITIFYLGGMAFAYFILLPAGLGFLLQFGTDIATPAIRITEYMDLALAMIFWLGVVFEIPVLMLLLAKLRLVSHKGFSKVRKYVPIAALILSGIITPTPDWVNQTLVAVPLILLYELGIFLSWLVRPKGIRDERR